MINNINLNSYKPYQSHKNTQIKANPQILSKDTVSFQGGAKELAEKALTKTFKGIIIVTPKVVKAAKETYNFGKKCYKQAQEELINIKKD